MARPVKARIILLFLCFWGTSFALAPLAPLSTDAQEFHVSTAKITSSILEEERTLSISLPQGYDSESQSYPVLFVLDAEGQQLFQRAVSTVSDLHAQRLGPRMIVIGIWNTVRNRDMIPQAVSHRPGSGGSDKFLDFIKGEVLPYVKRTYRAADFSVLYGMSNSALFAVFALLEEPETFDAYIASSPMIGHCPQFIREKAEAFKKRKSLNCRLIMIYGSEDSPRVTEHVPDFRDYLESNAPQGFRVYLVILEGAGHVPESSLALGLRYVYGKAVK